MFTNRIDASNTFADPSEQKHTISSFAFDLWTGDTQTFSITVDPTLGNNTEFIIDFDDTILDFLIITPTGQEFTKDSPEVVNDDVVFTSRLTFMDASGVCFKSLHVCTDCNAREKTFDQSTKQDLENSFATLMYFAFPCGCG